MMVTERAVLLGAAKSLVSILTEPARHTRARSGAVAVIFLNAGVIHRVGPSRMYVRLARELAARGWLAARFDHSGIGDSASRKDNLSFDESAVSEVREVMDELERTRGTRRFVLIGLCSGAVTSFDCAVGDTRVAGIVMINPQGFDASSAWNQFVTDRSQARRYWSESLFSLRSWRNALTGRIDYRRLASVIWREAVGRVRPTTRAAVAAVATRVSGAFARLAARGVRSLLLCSEGDDGIEYMNVILGRDVRRVESSPSFAVAVLPGADHSLTLIDSQRRVCAIVSEWASALSEDGRQDAESAAGQPAVSSTRPDGLPVTH